jgi:hemerythrin
MMPTRGMPPTVDIVIIDDTRANLRLLSSILTRQGYQVRPIVDGAAAIAAVQANPPDLILLDIVMPTMDGYAVCQALKADPRTSAIPIIFISALDQCDDKVNAFLAGGVDYIPKPFEEAEVVARVNLHLELQRYRQHLEALVAQRTAELLERNRELEDTQKSLYEANQALSRAMKNLHTIRIADGVHWVQIPEADLYILCGCPDIIVKLLMKKGLIVKIERDGVLFETGPNAILLSDILIQNGIFSNLAEFPVLQMLYRQGMLIPKHPNNTGRKPLLIGAKEQVAAQMEYIARGNYGLYSRDEILAAGIAPDLADEMMAVKLRFAFGKILPTDELLDTCIVENAPVEIRNGVFVERKGFNEYEFSYKGRSVRIDLNVNTRETYPSPYPLAFHQVRREYFAVIHTGEGDGWDMNRPCMASMLIYLGKVYLIDAGPNIVDVLRALSIDISEIEGIFHTHAHDDHFAGLPTLMHADHRLKYYATPLVRESVSKKLSALMSMDGEKFFQYFEVHDLQFDAWNDINGLEVKPLYSPHPVETNILLFRTLGKDGYKTYAHWADICALGVLHSMIGEKHGQRGISQTFYDTVKANYLLRTDMKKIDVGGGLIHGQATDFRADRSREIILAHTSETLTAAQKEIGSERSFGAIDVMISTDQDYLLKRAAELLHTYFPVVPFERLRTLLNTPVVSFNPGTIIQAKGSLSTDVYFILAGTVEFISAEFRLQNYLSNGCLIGDVPLLKNTPSAGTWRTVSYVQALRFPAQLYHAFLEQYNLYDQMNSIVDHIDFLQKTFLFGERLSYPVQNTLAQQMTLKHYDSHARVTLPKAPAICLVKQGTVQVLTHDGTPLELVQHGDFCGEERLFPTIKAHFRFQAVTPLEIYLVQYPLLDIPIVHWKLLERCTKRTKLSRSRYITTTS